MGPQSIIITLAGAAAVTSLPLFAADFAASDPTDIPWEAQGHATATQSLKPYHVDRTWSDRLDLTGITAPVVSLDALNMTAIEAEDEELTADGFPLRIGKPRSLEVFVEDGQWLTLDGARLWRLDVHCTDAFAVRLFLRDMDLPVGSEVWTSTPDGSEPTMLTGTGPFGDGAGYVRTTVGDTARIEYYVPDADASIESQPLPFQIDHVQHNYKASAFGGDAIAAAVEPCHLDRTCYPDYDEVSEACCTIGISGGFVCSGTLLATVVADGTPYFTTARHCVSSNSQAHSLEARWDYETNVCNSSVSSGSTTLYSDLIHSYDKTDSTLVKWRGELPTWNNDGIYHAAWSAASIASGTYSVGVHHPGGSWQRISFGTVLAGDLCAPDFLTWDNPIQWSDGTIEGGSSGSGLFRNYDRKFIGIASCGSTEPCATTVYAGYGEMNKSYSPSYGGWYNYLIRGEDDDLEDNDSCEEAVEVANGTHSDLHVMSGDEDWYKFSLGSGGQVSLILYFTDAYGDIDMVLYRGCDGEIEAVSQSNSNNETMTFTNWDDAGTFYLRVYMDTDTHNTYSMSVDADEPPDGPDNDECDGSLSIANGANTFDTQDATSSDPAEGGCDVGTDVWYHYSPDCTGQAIFSISGDFGFTPVGAVYSTCPSGAGELLACMDDSTGNYAAVPCTQDQLLLIRLGSSDGEFGEGTVISACVPGTDCPADCSGDGTVGVADLLILLDIWGQSGTDCDPNGDGTVNVGDLLDLIDAWGGC
jgi:hypothetical protein